jgi:hypothetical protein
VDTVGAAIVRRRAGLPINDDDRDAVGQAPHLVLPMDLPLVKATALLKGLGLLIVRAIEMLTMGEGTRSVVVSREKDS